MSEPSDIDVAHRAAFHERERMRAGDRRPSCFESAIPTNELYEAAGEIRALLVLCAGRPDIRIDVHDASAAMLLAAIEGGGHYTVGKHGSRWVDIGRLTVWAKVEPAPSSGEP
jgi:hypothetical protein